MAADIMGKRRLSPLRREFPKALISMNRDLSRFKNPFRQFNDAVIRGQETGFASKYRSLHLSFSLFTLLQFVRSKDENRRFSAILAILLIVERFARILGSIV